MIEIMEQAGTFWVCARDSWLLAAFPALQEPVSISIFTLRREADIDDLRSRLLRDILTREGFAIKHAWWGSLLSEGDERNDDELDVGVAFQTRDEAEAFAVRIRLSVEEDA